MTLCLDNTAHKERRPSREEQERLAAVEALQILDTEPEAVFDDAVQLAATICGTPVSLVSILDGTRQWFKARVGLDATETPIEQAFCAHAIQQPEIFQVPDAQLDSRFRENPLVKGAPGIRFYAGVPLTTTGARAVGTLCVIDTRPRQLTTEQQAALTLLARQVSNQLQLRAQMKSLKLALVEKESIERALASSNSLFQAFMDHSPMVGYMKDEAGRMLYYNRPFAERFRVTPTEWIGKDDFELWPLEFASGFRAADLAVLNSGKLLVKEETSPGVEGETIHWRSYKFPFINDEGQRFLAGLSLDVSAEREAQEQLKLSHETLREVNEQLRALTVTDALTGLCNRRGFDDKFQQEFANALRYGQELSLLLFDVDDFKSLNDTFGHEEGDKVLRQIADLLGSSGRRSDIVCRYGGEEFAILLPNTSLVHAMLLGKRIRRKVEANAWQRRPITISGGASTSVPGVREPAVMLRRADLALYEAKARGKNRIESFDLNLEPNV